MQIGTKSILFGAHQFMLHPWFVAAAWWKLYGFPWDPRLWVAFFVHDLGYLGKPNMDGPEGERHPELGAWIMTKLFDRSRPFAHFSHYVVREAGRRDWLCGKWGQFCMFHSRFYAHRAHENVSKLGVADKLAIVLTPAWLYFPMVKATGEVREYMSMAKAWHGSGTDERQWYADVQDYLRNWVEVHKDGRPDTWTGDLRKAKTDSGVWQ